jgi:predicted permease
MSKQNKVIFLLIVVVCISVIGVVLSLRSDFDYKEDWLATHWHLL